MIDDDVSRGEAAAVCRRAGRDTEAKRHVSHRVDHNALVLRSVLRDAAKAGFEHIVAVKKGQLGGWPYPNLHRIVSCVGNRDLFEDILC